MTGEQLQPYFNIALNSGALPRILGEKLTLEEYDVLVEHITHALEAAVENERECCLTAIANLYHGDACRAAIRSLAQPASARRDGDG